MKKNTYQIFAAGLLLFISCSAYTFLSVIQTPEGAEKQLSEDELVKKEMLIQLPDVSIVQKAVALGEKLLEVY